MGHFHRDSVRFIKRVLMPLLKVPLQVSQLRAGNEKLHDCRLADADIALEAKLTFEPFELPLCLGVDMEAGLANRHLGHAGKMPRYPGFSALRFFGLSVGNVAVFAEE